MGKIDGRVFAEQFFRGVDFLQPGHLNRNCGRRRPMEFRRLPTGVRGGSLTLPLDDLIGTGLDGLPDAFGNRGS